MSRATLALITGIALLAFGVGAYNSHRYTNQPFAFNHAAHVKGADCGLCHAGIRTGARAGIPDLNFCTGCHAVAPGKPSVAAEAAWKKAAAGETVPWNRVYRLPSHVYFSHRRHVVLAELTCVTCHGDIAQRAEPLSEPLERLKMRDCIACHEKNKVTADCTGCHR